MAYVIRVSSLLVSARLKELPTVAYLPSWLPGMKFLTIARKYREQYFSLAEDGHQMVKDDIVSQASCQSGLLYDCSQARGTARPSITHSSLTEGRPGANPDEIIMFAATQVYTGMKSCFFALSDYNILYRWGRHGKMPTRFMQALVLMPLFKPSVVFDSYVFRFLHGSPSRNPTPRSR